MPYEYIGFEMYIEDLGEFGECYFDLTTHFTAGVILWLLFISLGIGRPRKDDGKKVVMRAFTLVSWLVG